MACKGLVAELNLTVGSSKRSVLIAESVREDLSTQRKEKLRKEMKESYKALVGVDRKLNEEWK